VLVVQGDKELLVPFIEDVIVSVDLKARMVIVEWEPI
jgi:ribosomal 30S subunit maturation factor RimM